MERSGLYLRNLEPLPTETIFQSVSIGNCCPYLKQLKFDIKYILTRTSYQYVDNFRWLRRTFNHVDGTLRVQNGVLLAAPFLTSVKAENHFKVEDNLAFLQGNPAPEYG